MMQANPAPLDFCLTATIPKIKNTMTKSQALVKIATIELNKNAIKLIMRSIIMIPLFF